MSHLRNLFHGSAGQRVPQTAPAAAPTGNFIVDVPNVATATPVLPEFPIEESHLGPESRLVYYADPRSPAADRYRLLRMHLKEHWRSSKLKKLLVTGPMAHEGKSTVLLNLATALAERGKRTVLVIEADLHHPSLTEILRLRTWAGLTECLVDGESSPLSAIRQIEPLGWYLLPAGEPHTNPTELLQSPAFGRIMQKLSPCFDWILIDSPPVIPVTDPLSLQQHTDGTLLVVRAGQTPREAVEQTVMVLEKKNIVGIVLNGMEARDHLYYQYYDANKRAPDD